MKYLNWIDITPASSSAWTTFDLTPYVGSDAGNVAGIYFVCTNSGGGGSIGMGKTGATGSRLYYYCETGSGINRGWCGINSNDEVDVWYGISGMKIYAIGYYTTDEATFLDTYIEKTISAVSTWTDIDISADTGSDTAVAALLQLYKAVTTTQQGVRKNGSSQSAAMYSYTYGGRDHSRCIAVDSSEIFEAWTNYSTDPASSKFRLIGYLKSNYTDLDAVARNATGTGWQWVDLNGIFTNSDDINGVYYHIKTSSSNAYNRALSDYYRTINPLSYTGWTCRGGSGGWLPIDRYLRLQQSCAGGTSDDLYITGVSQGSHKFDKPLYKIRT